MRKRLSTIAAIMALSAGATAEELRRFGPAPGDTVPADVQRLGEWHGRPANNFRWIEVDAPPATQVTLKVTIPAGHETVTVVIEHEDGTRVRNLVSMGRAEEYGGRPQSGEPQVLTMAWNRRNDDGELAPPGNYRVRGLSLPTLRMCFDYAWYNPGEPPWTGYPNSGWGGDHVFPTAVACPPAAANSAWRAIVGGPVAEGGDAVFALDRNDRKTWRFTRHWWGVSANAIAVDDEALWLGLPPHRGLPATLVKFELGSGRFQHFQRPVGIVQEIKIAEGMKALAVGGDWLAVLTDSDHILFMERRSARRMHEVELATPARDLLFHPFAEQAAGAGAVLVATDSGLLAVTPGGKRQPVKLADLEKPGAMAADAAGGLQVMDLGGDAQIKVYDAEKRLRRTIGTRGGQIGERYDPQAVRTVSSIAVDDQGLTWVVESAHPRRIAVFNTQGTLDRDFVGNATYGASHLTHHEQDPTLTAGYGVVFKVDPDTLRDYAPLRYMNRRPQDGPTYRPHGAGRGHYFHRGQMFRSAVSGALHEYYLDMSYDYPVLFLERDGVYQPVASIGGTPDHNPVFPAVEGDRKVSYLWSDQNGDGMIQPEELQRLGGAVRTSWFYNWTHLIGPDLEFFVAGQAIRPVGFTADGAPLYDLAQANPLATQGPFMRAGNHLVGTLVDRPYAIGKHVFADLQGNPLATFPMNAMGVHASSRFPIPEPGTTCGELMYLGMPRINETLGHVVAIMGNMGQIFLFSEDGLYLGNLCRDVRQRGQGPGPEMIKGEDWTDRRFWGEPFGGWFGKQDDGVVRLTFGRQAALVTRVEGLEKAIRFDAGHHTLAAHEPETALATTPAAMAPDARIMHIPSIAGRTLDDRGLLQDWSAVKRWPIGPGDDAPATVALAHDGERLHLSYQVVDRSPMANAGEDYTLLFKTGAAVDLHLGPAEGEDASRVDGTLRLLVAPTAPEPVAMRFRPDLPGAPKDAAIAFSSPVRTVTFDLVERCLETKVEFATTDDGYRATLAVPFAALGIRYAPGLRLRGDLGVLLANQGGMQTERRWYLFNLTDTLTTDIPSEAELKPRAWGKIVLD